MYFQSEFIGDYSATFLQVGCYDENELSVLGYQDEVNVSLELDALHCLRFFPHVSNLILRPGEININDLHYLYSLSIKRLKLDYYSDSLDEYSIDLGKFCCLEHVFSRTQYNFHNAEQSIHLKTLTIQEWYTPTLECLQKAPIISLTILSGKLTSTKGIEHLHQLKTVSLSNQRSLTNLSGVDKCNTLETLEIESCNKLCMDTIPELPFLRSLCVIGKQTIADCSFFLRFPKLERLILGIKIIDGNITPLLNLRHCVILSDCRHYTHRNSDMPKL